ncbi:helix-turn-helix domain-containing protein [Enterococcus sp. LJL99]
MKIYEKVKKLAIEKGVSIAQVERDCELSSASISKWNVSVPSAKKLNLVASYFDVDIQDLLSEEEV